MSDYEWLSIGTVNDYDRLHVVLDQEFGASKVIAQLKSSITNAVRGILVERGYIDKDYRSTYYHFYTKKGRPYRRDCVRLHFFDQAIGYDTAKTDLTCSDGSIDHHYFGFMVLRPTIVATIGRTILSPDVRAGARGNVIMSEHGVHVLGHRLSVWGFPAMAQHADISVCAHVSCWAILRHYSERFPQHRELLTQDITMLAQQFDPGGLTPSLGLNVSEAERIFQAAGTYPLIIARGGNDEEFYAQLLAYLESGFPLFISMESRLHAIVAVGYAWRSVIKPPPFTISHVWEQIEAIIAVDDNQLPYRLVPVNSATGPSAPQGLPANYSVADFDGFIVPLPEKIFYSAGALEPYSLALYRLLSKSLPMPPQDRLLRRYFITTISAIRRYAREYSSQLGDELVNILMRLEAAQFIWVIEYASHDQWEKGHITARAIIDATASERDPLPVWFAHGEYEGIRFDRSTAKANATVIDLRRPQATPLGRMEQNLRPIRATA